MKSLMLIPFAALMLGGCAKKSEAPQPAAQLVKPVEYAPAKPPLQRLVGTLGIVEDYAIDGNGKPSFITRKMQLNGKVDQLVRVRESDEGYLVLATEGDGRLIVSGTITETGNLAVEEADSNLRIKGRGESAWEGKLSAFELEIRRSTVGAGDEIRIRLQAPMSGTLVTDASTRFGTKLSLDLRGTDPRINSLQQDPEDPARRIFEHRLLLFPALQAVPSSAAEKQGYEVVKATPDLFHIGLVTSPDRRSWTYSGHKRHELMIEGSRWGETVNLSLKLTQP